MKKKNKNSKAISIKDLAKSLGLSSSTVSRALNNNPRISKKTREKVQAQAKLMNYRHNDAAASLRTGKTQTFGVIIPLANRSFFASIISSIETMLNKSNYNVIICQTNEKYEREKAAIDALLKARVDGIAISVSAETIDFSHFELVKDAGIPLILFDRTYDEIGAHQVVIDDRLGSKMATDHLIKQGCTHILHIGGRQHISIYKNRTLGYLDSLEAAGIKSVEEFLVYTDAKEESAKTLIKTYLDKGIHFDGIVAASDFSAIGAMQTLQKTGKKIPDDVAIIGFADEPFTKWVTPSLSSINQDTLNMGESVADLFLSLMEKSNHEISPPVTKVSILPELKIRSSSKRG